jgi:hypothetical protein
LYLVERGRPTISSRVSGSARRGRKGGMSTPEPGLDLHDWQTQMQQLDDELQESPLEALPEFADFIERILVERHILSETGEPVTEETADPEIIDRYRAAREIATLAEAGDADPGDLADAINQLRELYEFLVVGRGAP